MDEIQEIGKEWIWLVLLVLKIETFCIVPFFFVVAVRLQRIDNKIYCVTQKEEEEKKTKEGTRLYKGYHSTKA